MQLRFIFILFLILPLSSYAQINSSIDIVLGMEFSYRSLKLDSDVMVPVAIVDLRNNREIAKLNWRFGLNYNKRLSNKFFLKTGLRLASVGYKDEKQTNIRWPSEIGSNGYVFDPSLPHEIQFIHDFWFIEIPLIARYEFNNKKLSPFVEAGISPSYYLITRTKNITDLGTNTVSQRGGGNSPYKNIHLVGVISAGANFLINEKMQLFGQAIYRRHMTALVDAPINEYLYNFGLEFGVRRKI